MDTIKEVIEFLLQYKDVPISVNHIILASVVSIAILSAVEFFEKKSKDKVFNPKQFLIQNVISISLISLTIWIFGGGVLILAIALGILGSVWLYNKYFKEFMGEPLSKEDVQYSNELNRLKKEFRNNPHYSILEVLLYYGYISQLQKEYIETENIFDSPDEMSKKLLNISALTPNQLKEAKAIMNVIRREGKILTKQEALFQIAKLEERRESDGQASKDSES